MRAHLIATLVALPILNGCIVVPAPYTMRASGTFTGRVLDAQSKSPVTGASVEVTGYPKTAQLTGSDGCFTVGPARKWYWYFIIGLHQHWIPEPEPPERVGSIVVSHPSFTPSFVGVRGNHWDRAAVDKVFGVEDVMLKQRPSPGND